MGTGENLMFAIALFLIGAALLWLGDTWGILLMVAGPSLFVMIEVTR